MESREADDSPRVAVFLLCVCDPLYRHAVRLRDEPSPSANHDIREGIHLRCEGPPESLRKRMHGRQPAEPAPVRDLGGMCVLVPDQDRACVPNNLAALVVAVAGVPGERERGDGAPPLNCRTTVAPSRIADPASSGGGEPDGVHEDNLVVADRLA